ncbi:hypothetical protein FHR32_004501 [Streptosporangium album]|uniref:Uncharacterized protein n=1 Tax=Streptosporangium album TaxID=47479 RepID=A0A7W7RZG5_9ACTN|nr:hypothetical protein [Streptosporangium album]MBB4940196.1 hypothetical protein [Streptosporangium album]
MGKFDGMDPKLVRDLLHEVRRAATEMRETEAQILQLMNRADLSSTSSHRPARIADAGDAMVRDVTARVTLLEKKIKHDVSPPTEPKAGEPKAENPEPDAGSQTRADAKPDTPKVEDLKPAVPKGDEGPPRDQPQSQGQPADDQPRDGAKPDPKPDTGSESTPDSGADSKPDTGSKGDETSPRDGGSLPDTSRNAPESQNESVSDGGADSKPDAGSKGDERSPRDGGATTGIEVLDTARQDHPDDVDQRGDMKPRVVAVDGVQVLQIPLDSPTAAEVTELLKNIEDIPPLDMPAADGVPDATGVPSDRIDFDQTQTWDDSAASIPDTVEPVPDQTIQPPGTGGETDAPSTGTLPESGRTPSSETTVGESAAWWADDGSDVVSVQTAPPDVDAVKTLADNARGIEPMDMPSVRVPDGETWGEGGWTPMDIGPDGRSGDVDPGDPPRPIPPPGGRSGGQ